SGDESALGEAPHPRAEHSGREGLLADDDPRTLGRVGELRAYDPVEHEVAERPTRMPPLERAFCLDDLRAGGRVDLERLEPLDPGEAVAELAAPLGLREMGVEPLRVVLREAARPQPLERLVRPHVAARARPRRRPRAPLRPRRAAARAGARGETLAC